MLILYVLIHVKPEHVAAFQAATIENATQTRREPGVVRFDFVQQSDDPTRFALWEVYRDAAAHASHRETPHFNAWAAKVPDMMAEPRSRVLYKDVFPPPEEW